MVTTRFERLVSQSVKISEPGRPQVVITVTRNTQDLTVTTCRDGHRHSHTLPIRMNQMCALSPLSSVRLRTSAMGSAYLCFMLYTAPGVLVEAGEAVRGSL